MKNDVAWSIIFLVCIDFTHVMQNYFQYNNKLYSKKKKWLSIKFFYQIFIKSKIVSIFRAYTRLILVYMFTIVSCYLEVHVDKLKIILWSTT